GADRPVRPADAVRPASRPDVDSPFPAHGVAARRPPRPRPRPTRPGRASQVTPDSRPPAPHASWLVASGVDLYASSRHLGHESITTTADRFGHLLPDQERQAAEAAARAVAAPTA